MSDINKNGLTFQEWALASKVTTDQHVDAWQRGEDPSDWRLANQGAATVKLVNGDKVKVPCRMWEAGELKDNWHTRGVAESNMRVVLNDMGHCVGWLDD